MKMSIIGNIKRLAGFIVGILWSLQAQSQMMTILSTQTQVDSIRWINKNSKYIESLKIIGNEIENLDSLAYIENVYHLEIIDVGLRSLRGLNNIKSISSLTLKNNLLLDDITHFDSLRVLNGYNIIDCPLISKIDVMPLLQSNYIGLSIEGDTRSLKVIDGFKNSIVGSLYLLNNTGVEYLYGGDNFKLETCIISQNKSLKEIVGMNGDYAICGDTTRMDLGFGTEFRVTNNDSLQILDALNGVLCLELVEIYTNNLLRSIKVGDKCEYISIIGIGDSDSIQSILGFNKIKKVTDFFAIHISALPVLKELNIVNNFEKKIRHIGLGHLHILSEVNSFDKVSLIDDLDVIDCRVLHDLFFLPKLEKINRSLKLFWNYQMEICNIPAVCDFLPNAIPDFIRLNAPGCNSIEEIAHECLSPVEDLTEDFISIYPNPVNDYIFIQSKNGQRIFHIYDILGKFIVTKNLDPYGKLDVSDLKSGVFFIKTEDGVSKKFIKL